MSLFNIERMNHVNHPTGSNEEDGFFHWSGNGFHLGLVIGAVIFLFFLLSNRDFVDLLSEKPTTEVNEPVTDPVAPVGTSDKEGFPDRQVCKVRRCVDGDTLIVVSGDKEWRVRMTGVDTPETVKPNTEVEPMGPEASAYTQRRIQEFNQIVTLQVDGDRYDQYGRRLALVYLGKEMKSLLNEELIRQGLGRAELQYHYSDEMKRRFERAEKDAKSDRLGIWSLQTK